MVSQCIASFEFQRNREICAMYENSKSQLFIEIYVQLIQQRLSFQKCKLWARKEWWIVVHIGLESS